MVPLVFFTIPQTAPISVVFPAPLGPRSAKISPAPMVSETPASAVTSRYRLTSCSTSRTGVGLTGPRGIAKTRGSPLGSGVKCRVERPRLRGVLRRSRPAGSFLGLIRRGRLDSVAAPGERGPRLHIAQRNITAQRLDVGHLLVRIDA